MSVKTMAAVIVASLVAGVVLGSFGIAGAGTGSVPQTAACPPGMECGSAATQECGSATMDCAGEGTATAPGAGACADCQ